MQKKTLAIWIHPCRFMPLRASSQVITFNSVTS